ncbi:hypothetical protein WOLCODRAFT_152448 [Wolfiporia cocos MD-104 SS10]|uniref:Uncharacterized protein n=1 Tax=Wolfiporia cocos (strain MD-104) TaxID=742152 RepID=A0A2H3JU49_WOLCO|nr:hypothetical protein WOLCODRAFT_152448 [Wolfiporia cocos MD-104 SS10]
MKSTLFAVAALVAGVASLTIDTPSDVSECVPTQFTWSGGVAPYYLGRLSLTQQYAIALEFLQSIEPGSDPSGTPLQQYGPLSGTSLTWSTNITANTQVSLTIKDSTGATDQSAPFEIGTGSTSCLSASAGSSSTAAGTSSSSAAASSSASSTSSASDSSSGSSTSAASSSASSGASTSASGSSSAATSTSPSGSSSATSSSASATNTASGNTSGAMANAASLAVAGIVGAGLAAILA